MRLGQLARKLAVRPTDIVEFLGQSQIEIHEGVNTRLDADHVSLIMGQFAPESDDEPVPNPEMALNLGDNANHGAPDDTPLPLAEDQQEDTEPAADKEEKWEVIKAPKVELTGLKVLGKIELPEPKKNPFPDALEGDAAADEPENRTSPKENQKDHQKKKYPQRPKKNPIAFKREREVKERRRKEEEHAAVEKERKTRYYHSRVKQSPPTKPMRLVDEPLEQMSAEELVEPPKTWLGKMIRWFTNA
jgi:hypothetical protein